MNRQSLPWVILLLTATGFLVVRTATGDMGREYAVWSSGATQAASASEYVAGGADVSLWRSVGLWVAAIGTLFIFSFLYADNPCYKVAEAVLVGVSAGYAMIVGFWTVIIPNLLAPLFPKFTQSIFLPGTVPVRSDYWWLNIVPLVLGIMLLMRLSPAGGWIARWPLAFIIGSTAGLRLIAFVEADFLAQIRNTVIPLITIDNGRLDAFATFSNVLLLIGVVSCLVYFFFSIEHTGFVGGVSRVGIWYLMITFGAAFGFTVMGRVALLAIRFEFLFDNWLWLIDPTQRRLGL